MKLCQDFIILWKVGNLVLMLYIFFWMELKKQDYRNRIIPYSSTNPEKTNVLFLICLSCWWYALLYSFLCLNRNEKTVTLKIDNESYTSSVPGHFYELNTDGDYYFGKQLFFNLSLFYQMSLLLFMGLHSGIIYFEIIFHKCF